MLGFETSNKDIDGRTLIARQYISHAFHDHTAYIPRNIGAQTWDQSHFISSLTTQHAKLEDLVTVFVLGFNRPRFNFMVNIPANPSIGRLPSDTTSGGLRGVQGQSFLCTLGNHFSLTMATGSELQLGPALHVAIIRRQISQDRHEAGLHVTPITFDLPPQTSSWTSSGPFGAGGGFSNRLVIAGIEEPLRKCEEALRDAVERLERLVLNVSAGKSSSFAVKMKDIRWPFRQGEIRTMFDRIERLKSLVSLAFQTSLMEFVEMARDELVAVGLNMARIESTVSAIEADQRGAH
ncbi:hypothetical protein BD779DRAFT_1475355 [Infundibulicybe gibba]|nr:hypothetical protein BD779DRAFT_1475355 [Infundibulicybe gibba]